MKKSRLFQMILCGLILVQFASGADLNRSEGYNLELKISCPIKKLRVGDEIPIEFTITNNGDMDYRYETRNYDRSGRFLEYQLYAKDKNGKPVPDPRKDIELGIMGGLSGGWAIISKG